MNTGEWRILPIRGGLGTITHPWIAVSPGCPSDRPPTRWCACKVHTSAEKTLAYIKEQTRG